jgi:hypothetical protein
MKLSSSFSALWQHVVVPSARLVSTCIVTTVRAVLRASRVVARWGRGLLQAARRRPIAAVAAILGLGLSWSVFGLTPMLAASAVVLTLRVVGGLGIHLFRSLMPARHPSATVKPRSKPSFHSRPMHRPMTAVLDGVS